MQRKWGQRPCYLVSLVFSSLCICLLGCLCVALKRAFDCTTQRCNSKHGHSDSTHAYTSQPAISRHSVLLNLGFPCVTRTCTEVYCYYLVRVRVGIFVSLFWYFSCSHSGQLNALSLSQNKVLRRKLVGFGTAVTRLQSSKW